MHNLEKVVGPRRLAQPLDLSGSAKNFLIADKVNNDEDFSCTNTSSSEAKHSRPTAFSWFKKLFFLAFCMPPLLSGCAPAIVAAGASAAGGAIIYDERSLDTMYHDTEIVQQAQYNLKSDPDLKGFSHITISSFNYTVVMIGQVAKPELREKAYQLVHDVPNIKHIYNEVTVEGLTSAATRSSDVWITTKVKSAMLAEKGLHSAQIKVVTEDGVVYLMGLVTQKHADIATNVARSVMGVRKVVRAFEYLS